VLRPSLQSNEQTHTGVRQNVTLSKGVVFPNILPRTEKNEYSIYEIITSYLWLVTPGFNYGDIHPKMETYELESL